LHYLQEAAVLARQHQLGLHLDGARIFNAAVKLGVPVTAISHHFDSVSFCLSKGLGAPIGSVFCGNEVLVTRARRWRKVLGGGMRQAGIIAAAAIVALEHHVERLQDDHENAVALGRGLAEIEAVELDPAEIQTNMVFLRVDSDTAVELGGYLRQRGILISGRDSIRLVTHLDITRADIERVVLCVKTFFGGRS
jgi:threonine aldolase